MKRSAKIGIGIGVVAAMAVGGYLVAPDHTGKSVAGTPTKATSTPVPVAPGGAITSTSGGTPGPHGVRFGFPSTCDGAVEAATSYLPVLRDPTYPLAGPAGADLASKILDPSIDPNLRAVLTTPNGSPFPSTLTFHPGWGGFKILSCEAGKSATILIWSGVTFTPPVQGIGRWYGLYDVELLYGTDWKFTGAGGPGSTTSRADKLAEIEFGNSFNSQASGPAPSSEVAQALKSASPGWQEYADAPK